MEKIKKRVNRLINFYHTRNPFELAKNLNVLIVEYPLDGVRGFYHYFQRNNIIYLDERLTDKEKAFVCAHELGHMLLHKTSNALFMDSRTHFKTQRYEIEANKFAMELLIADDLLKEHPNATFEQLARITGYHEKLIELKFFCKNE
jgi:Predicted Zn peptidase